MWKLSIDDDDNNRTIVKLVRSEYTIGRAEKNAIRLVDRNVSRAHAELVQTGKSWVIRDLDSSNGCYLNGNRVRGQAKARHGNLLEIGDYRIHITDDGVASDLEPNSKSPKVQTIWPSAHGSRQEQDRLVVIGGPGIGTQYPLGDGRFLIGRGEECAVSVAQASVSRAHAEIIGASGSYEIIDRGSSNGLYLNGTRLLRTFLHAGDVVEIGESFLKFVPRGSLDRNVPLSEQATALLPIPGRATAAMGKRKLAFVGAIVLLGVLISIAVRGRGLATSLVTPDSASTKVPGATNAQSIPAGEPPLPSESESAPMPHDERLSIAGLATTSEPEMRPNSNLSGGSHTSAAVLLAEKRTAKVVPSAAADHVGVPKPIGSAEPTPSDPSTDGKSEIIRKSPF